MRKDARVDLDSVSCVMGLLSSVCKKIKSG